jgi:UDP-glucose 4-epimerase
VLDTLDPFYDVGTTNRNIETATAAAADGDGEYRFIEESVTDKDLVQKLVKRANYIFDKATQQRIQLRVQNLKKMTDINLLGTFVMLEAARDADIVRYVNASSSSVYGSPDDLPHDEAHPTTPVSPYAALKLSIEHDMHRCYEVKNIPRCHTDISISTDRECVQICR